MQICEKEKEYETFFSTESKEQRQNLKQTEITPYMRGATLSSIPHCVGNFFFRTFKKAYYSN